MFSFKYLIPIEGLVNGDLEIPNVKHRRCARSARFLSRKVKSTLRKSAVSVIPVLFLGRAKKL